MCVCVYIYSIHTVFCGLMVNVHVDLPDQLVEAMPRKSICWACEIMRTRRESLTTTSGPGASSASSFLRWLRAGKIALQHHCSGKLSRLS